MFYGHGTCSMVYGTYSIAVEHVLRTREHVLWLYNMFYGHRACSMDHRENVLWTIEHVVLQMLQNFGKMKHINIFQLMRRDKGDRYTHSTAISFFVLEQISTLSQRSRVHYYMMMTWPRPFTYLFGMVSSRY